MYEFTGWVNLEEDLTREKRIIENMLHAVGKAPSAILNENVSRNALLGFVSFNPREAEEKEAGQPMSKSLGNSKFTITFIGQLKNCEEVVEKLHNLSMSCKENSDAEIILTAYMAWGQEFIKHIKGSYTLAIWDESRKALLLARGHMGEKHMFYGYKSDAIIFASNVKMLLAHPLLEPKAARQLNAGIPSEIKELQSGQCLIFDRQGIKIKE